MIVLVVGRRRGRGRGRGDGIDERRRGRDDSAGG